MRFVLGWTFKLAVLGALYLGFTGGFADQTSRITHFGRQAQEGFKSIASGLK